MSADSSSSAYPREEPPSREKPIPVPLEEHRPRVEPESVTEEAGAGVPVLAERPRRVLFFGKSKSRSACTGALVDSLRRAGVEVRWVNCSTIKRWLTKVPMPSIVRWIYRRYQPDMIFVFFHDLPPVLMEEFSRQTPTVVWMEEHLHRITRSQLEYVLDAKLLCLSTPDLVESYRDLGVPHATFLMSGFSPSFHKPHSSVHRPWDKREYDRDLAFIGGPGEIEDRPGFLAWLTDQGLQLDVFGLKEHWLRYLRRYPQLRFAGEARPSRYAEICARSKIVVGMNQTHESWLYFSNRIFLTLACQGFHLTKWVPGMDLVFDRNEHLDWFEDRHECLERIEHWLSRDQERCEVARQGMEHVLAQHTYEHRVREILDILVGKRGLSCPQPETPAIYQPMKVLQPLPAQNRRAARKPSGDRLPGPEKDELLAVRVQRRDLEGSSGSA
jgi:hypothetical protein